MNSRIVIQCSVPFPPRHYYFRRIVCRLPAVTLLHSVKILLHIWVVAQLVPALRQETERSYTDIRVLSD